MKFSCIFLLLVWAFISIVHAKPLFPEVLTKNFSCVYWYPKVDKSCMENLSHKLGVSDWKKHAIRAYMNTEEREHFFVLEYVDKTSKTQQFLLEPEIPTKSFVDAFCEDANFTQIEIPEMYIFDDREVQFKLDVNTLVQREDFQKKFKKVDVESVDTCFQSQIADQTSTYKFYQASIGNKNFLLKYHIEVLGSVQRAIFYDLTTLDYYCQSISDEFNVDQISNSYYADKDSTLIENLFAPAE